MPLTPADVHNVAFKKPPIGKRGYDEEEVDAFLDEVERELARLIEENNELRAQAERGGGRGTGRAAATATGRTHLVVVLDEARQFAFDLVQERVDLIFVVAPFSNRGLLKGDVVDVGRGERHRNSSGQLRPRAGRSGRGIYLIIKLFTTVIST